MRSGHDFHATRCEIEAAVGAAFNHPLELAPDVVGSEMRHADVDAAIRCRASGAHLGEDGTPLPLEIDLRGMTADEIGYPLAGALERAYHTGRPAIRFIHGKGTGVLRRRVAELLEKHPYVQAFRLGHWNEGGDGVTIATLAPDAEPEEQA